MSTPCSWCEAERGERTRGSHGICERHAALLRSKVEEMRGERLSGPYAERWLAKVSGEVEGERARYDPLSADEWERRDKAAAKFNRLVGEIKRKDQTEFSALVCFVVLAVGAAIAFGVWVWRTVL